MLLTILTPTYNRKNELESLYKSLQNQTSKDFEWLIVDDGSSDNTSEIINDFKSRADFRIRYVYKKNGGKHTALNVGIADIDSEMTFIVDSDDWLTDNAVSEISETYNKYKNRTDICGFAFLRKFPDGKINGKKFETNEKIESYITARINGDDTCADKAEVFFTKCLKEFPFPEYHGEKFLGEDIVWIRMARKYKMVHINKAIYVGNYLDEGLTNNRRKHNIASPIGCMHRAEEFMKKDINFKYRIKGTLQYIIYGRFAGYSIGRLVGQSHFKGLTIIFALPALVLQKKWAKDFSKNQ
ncbi:MAG: glycosyltransferase family 2 protein [Oscillospiraceae bacterium]